MEINGDVIGELENFKYLGSSSKKKWGIGMDV